MGGAPPPPPGLASPDPKSDHFFGIFRGFFGGPPGPPKTVKNDPPDPQKRPPGDLPGTPQKPPEKGGFWGVFGGFSGGILGSLEGGFSGSRRVPGAPEKGHFGGGDPGGRAARPPGEDRGGGGATMTTTARPRKPSDRGATFCVARYTNGIDDIRYTSTTPLTNIKRDNPRQKNFRTPSRHHDDMSTTSR